MDKTEEKRKKCFDSLKINDKEEKLRIYGLMLMKMKDFGYKFLTEEEEMRVTAFREDMADYLIKAGISPVKAAAISENARKGKYASGIADDKDLREVPDEYAAFLRKVIYAPSKKEALGWLK